jgi:hypothetical protein
MDDKKKKEYLQNRMPEWICPEKKSFTTHLDKIKKWCDAEENKTKEVLSVQLFSGHGVVSNGR